MDIFTNRMKAAIIGNWGHHVCVLEETDAMSDFSIVGLAPGFDGEDLSSLQNLYGGAAKTYEDPSRMLAEERPDVVIISTRLDRIADLAVQVAEAGCHSICEKPLALNHDDLARLWKAVTVNRTQCVAMLPNRCDPVLAAARREVEVGRIGKVRLLNARKSYKFSGPRTGWISKRESYGGTLPWIGIHALDFIETVAPVRFSNLSAMHANVAHPQDPDCEDICTMNLALADGGLATVTVDYLRPHGAEGHGDDWLRIVGTEGSLEAAMGRGQCLVIDREGCGEIEVPTDRALYYPPILRSLPPAGSAGPSEVTLRGFYMTHIALCARDAADTGTCIHDLRPSWEK